jgi:hypothetical protein
MLRLWSSTTESRRAIIARPLPTVNIRRGRNPLVISHVCLCQFAKVPGGQLEGLVPARAWGFKSPLRHGRGVL